MLTCGCVGLPKGLSVGSPTITAVTVAPTQEPTPAIAAVTVSPTTASAPAAPQGEEWYERTYSWEYKSVEWNFNVKISRTIYELYKSRPRGTSPNYADYALSEEDRDFLMDITAKLKDNGKANGYTGLDDVMNVLAFVQSLEYEEDDNEYTRYPLETLADQKGDCKDKSILAAAMLHEMGYDPVLLKFPNHMALGIRSAYGMQGASYEYGGSRYYYVETTSPNWNIGDIPGDLKGQTPTIYPISKSPTIEATLDVKPAGVNGKDSYYLVRCSLKNDGPGTALNMTAHVYALALERGPGKAYIPDKRVYIGDYAEGQNGTIEANLTVAAGERTQIFCVITGDNVNTCELKTSAFYG